MRVKVDGKNVNIPESVIEAGLREGLDRADIVERFLSDEGIKVDPVVAELTAKAKDSGAGAKADRKTRKPPVRKPDEVKRAIVAALAAFIAGQDGVTDAAVTNVERMIAFELAGDKFEITLTKKRKPKE
jgi:hypothetical protein